MRFTEISESTTAGSVSTVAMPLGKTQSRTQVSGLQPAQKVMGGTAKKKGPYANSISEGKKKVEEAELQEDDIIVVPGQGRGRKTGFVPHGQSRVDHEVEMARSDLFSASKNAEQIYKMIQSVSEDEGLEGWVQEKIIKANDYLNTVREYLEGKRIQQEAYKDITETHTEVKDKEGKVVSWKDDSEWHKIEKNKKGQPKDPRGVVTHLSDIARRKTAKQDTHEGVTENNQRGDTLVTDALKLMRGAEVSDAVRALTTVLGNREYNSRRGFYNFYIKQMIDMYNKQGVSEGAKVDRMVKHIEKSEEKAGKSKKEAENIAWATANKRGMLNNKNKKK